MTHDRLLPLKTHEYLYIKPFQNVRLYHACLPQCMFTHIYHYLSLKAVRVACLCLLLRQLNFVVMFTL